MILHPYRIYSLCFLVKAFRFVLHIVATENILCTPFAIGQGNVAQLASHGFDLCWRRDQKGKALDENGAVKRRFLSEHEGGVGPHVFRKSLRYV